MSFNGTSHKSVTYLSKHLTATMPGRQERVTLAMPITSMQEHMSQAQLDNIIDSLRAYSELWLRSLGKIDVFFWRHFIRKLVGASSDHASDQKLLIKLLEDFKALIDRELRGEEILKAQLSSLELMELIGSRLAEQRGGEPIQWSTLPEREYMRLISDTWRSICVPLGQDAYEQLTEEEKFKADLFIWAGCCMHKSLNACKAGYTEMTAAWKTIPGAAPPVKLISKDKRAAIDKGTAELRASIETAAEGGAIPHNKYCALTYKSADDKKGQQDMYAMEVEVRSLHQTLCQYLRACSERWASGTRSPAWLSHAMDRT
jgi:hypothetical protein